MRKFSLTARSGLSALALLTLMAAPAAHAATLLEQGPNYEIIQYCEGNPAGSVVLRLDTLSDGEINNAIYAVQPAPGWTYTVKKSGGVDQTIEVLFTNGAQTAKYKSLVIPGKTDISCPVVR